MNKNKKEDVSKETDYLERRKTARLDIPLKLSYRIVESDSVKNAVSRNVSAGGCLLLVSEKIPINSKVELEIFLGENKSESLNLKGRIVRLNREESGLYEFGIAFDEMSRDERRLFADFCFSKMYEMIGLSEWPTDTREKVVKRSDS